MIKVSILLGLFLVAAEIGASGVTIAGNVSLDDRGHAVLSMKLTNESASAICFEDWFPSRAELVVDRWLVESFIVKDAEGRDVTIPEPRFRPDVIGPPTLNRRVYMLKKGEDAEALIDLSSWYKFSPGSYTVSYLFSTLPCDKYADPESWLTDSRSLAYLGTADNLMVIRIMTAVGEHQNLVFLRPVEFQIPSEQVKEEN